MATDGAGHLFVVDGDLTRLHCDAILIPVDRSMHVTDTWSSVVEQGGRLRDVTVPDGWGSTLRAIRYRHDEPGPEIWLGDIGKTDADDDWFAAGLVEFVELAASTVPVAHLRKRTFAVNVAGSGQGGSAFDKGRLFTSIVPALRDAAERNDVDVVLVCWGEQQYAAAQRVRQRLEHERGAAVLEDRLEEVALRLARAARRSELVLFIGAGVSMGAGLRSWQGLLDGLLAGVDEPLSDHERFRRLDLRDQAVLLRRHFDTSESFQAALTDLLSSSRYSLAHGLLASLGTREAVTTNYDNLFERAAATAGRTCAILPREPVLEHDRWLLKLHGSIDNPDELVLTRDDYLGLPNRAGALFGVLQAMLMTRHMLFVGYSLTDDSFHKVMHEVRQARGKQAAPVGTALLLFDDPLLTELWADELDIVSVAPRPPDGPTEHDMAIAARRLDLLLDRVGLLAADVTSFLLDPTYRTMLDEEERELADVLNEAAARAADGSGPIAERLGTQLARMGAPQFKH